MKKIMTAALGLSLLSGTAVFAQNTAGSMGGTDTATKKKSKKSKKSKDSASSTTSTSTSK